MFPQRPTNFELIATMWIGKRQDGFYWRYDSIDLVEQLVQRGGRVGPALRDAIASGRMRAFLEKDAMHFEEEDRPCCRRLAALCCQIPRCPMCKSGTKKNNTNTRAATTTPDTSAPRRSTPSASPRPRRPARRPRSRT